MRAYDIIVKKRNKEELTKDEINFMIEGYTSGKVADYQMSAFLMAVFLNGLSDEELFNLTNAMLNSGKVLEFSNIQGFKVDKHSTGGVGDKISIPLAPLAASLGLYIPMVSGRGLGHTGGTLDKLESIPGYRVNLTIDEFKEVVSTVGCSIIGQTKEIAPADKKIYALRDVTGTVDSIPLIASSIMSKKLAEGVDGLLFDVKTGSGAFMKTLEDSRKLAEKLKSIGEAFGKKVVCFITDMNQPLGNQIGNSLEIIESIEILKGRGPSDTTELTVLFAVSMLVMSGIEPDEATARFKVLENLRNGRALEKFREMIKAHGGNPDVCDDYSLLPSAKNIVEIKSDVDGYVQKINTERLGVGVMLSGAGREKKEDKIDYGAGFTIYKKVGSRVKKGDVLGKLYYNSDKKIDEAVSLIKSSYTIGEEPLKDVPYLIKDVLKNY